MRILFVGDLNPRANSFRLCRTLKELGHTVRSISAVPIGRRPGASGGPNLWTRFRSSLGYPPDETNVNERIIREAADFQPDLVFVFKAMTVKPSTLRVVKEKANATTAFASFDNMEKSHNQSQYFLDCIQYYDIVYMARGYSQTFYGRRGAENVVEFDLGFDKRFLYPRASNRPYKYDVAFVGSYEENRFQYIKALAEHGIDVHVWGNGWEDVDKVENLHIKNRPVFVGEYLDTMHDSKIVLNFFRKMNDDVMNSRMFEVPASQSFMLSEHSDLAHEFFERNVEAVYFDSPAELREKADYYLEHKNKRSAIAQRGRQRCVDSGYDYHSRLTTMLEAV